MTLSRMLQILSVLVLAPSIACDVKVPETCTDLCNRLDDCGMLESALGDTLPGCLTKCVASSTESQGGLKKCLLSNDEFEEPPSGGGVMLEDWCEGGRCKVASQCISMLYGDDVTGSGSVSLQPCVPNGSEIDSAIDISMLDDVHAPDSCEVDETVSCAALTEQTQTAVDAICASFGLAEVRLESRERTEVLAAGACSDVLASTSSVRDGIPPGLYGVSLTLRSGPLADDECRKIYGERVMLVAGSSRSVRVFVPSVGLGPGHAHGCEDTEQACFDTEAFDEDADGASNCDDTDCQLACVESGPLCSDALDNDHDQLIDCDDPDCMDELACTSPETSTG